VITGQLTFPETTQAGVVQAVKNALSELRALGFGDTKAADTWSGDAIEVKCRQRWLWSLNSCVMRIVVDGSTVTATTSHRFDGVPLASAANRLNLLVFFNRLAYELEGKPLKRWPELPPPILFLLLVWQFAAALWFIWPLLLPYYALVLFLWALGVPYFVPEDGHWNPYAGFVTRPRWQLQSR
jgi:hypothetical protein